MATSSTSPAPIVVNPNPLGDNAAAAMRTVFILLGGLSAILGFLGKHDLAGLIVYLQSGSFLPVAGAALAVGSFVYAQWKSIARKRQLVTVAQAAPNKVAIVQTPDPAPKP